MSVAKHNTETSLVFFSQKNMLLNNVKIGTLSEIITQTRDYTRALLFQGGKNILNQLR